MAVVRNGRRGEDVAGQPEGGQSPAGGPVAHVQPAVGAGAGQQHRAVWQKLKKSRSNKVKLSKTR